MPRCSVLFVAAVLCGCTRTPAPVETGVQPAGPRQPAPSGTARDKEQFTQVVLDVPGMH